jgi:UPF0716 protein FxsA
MQLGLFLIFVAVPLIEIAILIKVGQWIGFGWTLFIVISTAITGSYILHSQGMQVVRRAIESISKGQAPIAPIVDGSFLMLAGALLLAPGILTDVVGLLLLIPFVRATVSNWSIEKLLSIGTFNHHSFGPRPEDAKRQAPRPSEMNDTVQPPDGPIIEGEFERLGERTIDPKRQNTPR